LDFLKSEKFREEISSTNKDLVKKIQNLLEKGKIEKVRKIIENPDKDLNDLERLVIEDVLATLSRDFKSSIDITNIIIKKHPGSFLGYLLQSWTYFILNEEEKSLEIIEQGLKISSNPILTCQKIQILIKINKLSDAKELIDNGLSTNPNDLNLQKTEILYHIYGECGCKDDSKLKDIELDNISEAEYTILRCILLCRAKRYKEAKKLLKSPEMSLNLFEPKPRIDIAAYFILIFSNLARGKYDKALELSTKVISNYPNHPNAILTRTLVYGYNLIYNYDEKEVTEVNTKIFFENTDNLIALDPISSNKSRYFQFKSYIFTRLKRYEEAIEALDAAIDLDPKRVDLYFSKNQVLLMNNEGEKAIQILETLIDKFPQKRKDFLKYKASAHAKNGNPEEGFKVLEELMKEYPDDINIINNSAIMLARLKKKEEAIEMAEKQISLAPKEGNPYDTYGEILMEFGDYEEAINEFKMALEIEPGGWFAFHAHTKMGKCYMVLEKNDLARKHLTKGCELEEKLLPNEKHIDVHDPHRYLAELDELEKIQEDKDK